MSHRTASAMLMALALTQALPSRSAAAVAPSEAATLATARRDLTTAVTTGGVQDILGVRARIAAIASRPGATPRAHYWLAVADWRVVPRLAGTKKPEAERYCMEGITEIDKTLARDAKDAEAIALKSNLLGMSLQFRPAAMMTLGGEIEAGARQAMKTAPDNPRVQLLVGLNTLNKPAFVGGGAEPALVQFVRSQELFAAAAAAPAAAAPADSTAPDWGRDDAYIWAGRAAMKLEQPAAAVGYYEKALEVTPGYVWVERSLLPEARVALAAKPAARSAAK